MTPAGPGKWKAICPSHPDKNPSLGISESANGWRNAHCFAGCRAEDVLTAVGLKKSDMGPPRNGSHSKGVDGPLTWICDYTYRNADGTVFATKKRFLKPDGDKTFRWTHPGPNGGTASGRGGLDAPLYRLPEVVRAIADGTAVWLVEGEKDADSLTRVGIETATSCPDGADDRASKWKPAHTESLRGAHVVLVPDNDPIGLAFAEVVASRLKPVTASLRVVTVPPVAGKMSKDVTEFLEAGGSPGDLLGAAEEAPELQPESARSESCGPSVEASEGPRDDTSELRGNLLAILAEKGMTSTQKGTAVANVVVEALAKRGQFYFHSDRRDFDSAMFFDSRRKRLERVRSDAFLGWLADWCAVNRAATFAKFIERGVETAALAGPLTTGIVPEAYFCARPGAVFLSCGDGSIVRVTRHGSDVCDNGTDGVLFAAGRTLEPWKLTDPRDPFEACAVFGDIRCGATHGRDLLRLWAYSLPTSPRSKPPLCLAGDVGSGKTRVAKGIAELYGMPFVASAVEESREDDFWPGIDAGGLFTLDNADTRCRWLADALASAATDGCSQRRKLYTNSETVTLRARAWVAVTTANPTFASDPGLSDRLLVVRMLRREGETADTALSDEIRANRDAGLSHVAETLRRALADDGPIPKGLNSRHPDFAAFAVRIGRALGREAESVAALSSAEADKGRFCIENDAVGAALLALVEANGVVAGTAAELGPRLVGVDSELEGRVTPKRLGKRLASLWPHLERVLNARKEASRTGISVFDFRVKQTAVQGLQGLDPHVSEKSPREEQAGEFSGMSSSNPANPAEGATEELFGAQFGPIYPD